MNEKEWLECTDPQPMLRFFWGKPVSRKLRLFAVGCCFRVRRLLLGEDSWNAVQVAERQAEVGELYQVETGLDEALARATDLLEVVAPRDRPYPNAPAYYATWQDALDAATSTADATVEAIQYDGGDGDVERAAQVTTIRDIFGNPFRRVALDPAWLAWNDGTLPKIAQAIYDDKAFDRMPILADALEEAGCTEQTILDHCRQPGEHVRGCWVVDLILGKE